MAQDSFYSDNFMKFVQVQKITKSVEFFGSLPAMYFHVCFGYRDVFGIVKYVVKHIGRSIIEWYHA